MSIDYFIRQNDHGQAISDTLKDASGAAVNIQGATVKLTVIPVGGGSPIINALTVVNDQAGDGSDGSKGKVHYAWLASQTVTDGLYLGSWTGTFADGSVQTFPNGGYILIDISSSAPVPAATRFASSTDLAARLGVDFTADEHVRAATLLALASGLIQQETKQAIALVTGDVITIPGSFADRIRLKERPVVSVASVVLNGISIVQGTGFYIDGDELIRMNWNSESSFRGLASSGWGFPWWPLVITYTHGYSVVPQLAKTICMEMAARVWVNPGAVIQEAVAGVQTTYAPYSAPPRGLLLTDAEKTDLRKFFGRTAGSIALR